MAAGCSGRHRGAADGGRRARACHYRAVRERKSAGRLARRSLTGRQSRCRVSRRPTAATPATRTAARPPPTPTAGSTPAASTSAPLTEEGMRMPPALTVSAQGPTCHGSQPPRLYPGAVASLLPGRLRAHAVRHVRHAAGRPHRGPRRYGGRAPALAQCYSVGPADARGADPLCIHPHTPVVEELYRTGKFEWMSRDADEDEHSIEMHLPYVYKAMEGCVPRAIH